MFQWSLKNSALALCVLIMVPSLSRADGESPKGPTLVVRVRSVEGLLHDAGYVAENSGQEQKVHQLHGLLQTASTDQGLQGIDIKRPLGMYGTLQPDLVSSTAVVLIPVADQKSLLALLDRFDIKAEREEADIYRLTSHRLPSRVPVYCRFANGYAYVTAQNKAAVQDVVPDPDKVFAGMDESMLAVQLRVDRVPESLRKMIVSMIELRSAQDEDRREPGETEAQHALRVQLIKNTSDRLASAIEDGKLLQWTFEVDRKNKQIVMNSSLSCRQGSPLARRLAASGQSRSLFAALSDRPAAASMVIHYTLPENSIKALASVVHESISRSLEHEKDAARRDQAQRFLTTLQPTLESGQFDFGLRINQSEPGKPYTLLAGVKVKDGVAIERALAELISGLPQRDRDRIHLDAETADGVAIHRIDAASSLGPQTRQILGDEPLFVAIRDDAVFLTGGANGLPEMKAALDLAPRRGPQIDLRVNLGRMVPLLTQLDSAFAQRIDRMGQQPSDGYAPNGGLHLSLDSGDSLHLLFTVHLEVIRFLHQLREHRTESLDKSQSTQGGSGWVYVPTCPPVGISEK